MGTEVAKPEKNIPAPNRRPATTRTHLGPILSLKLPPVIIVMGPTALATVNTMAREAISFPVSSDRWAAIGEANTLHAYRDPTQSVTKQLAIRISHLFFMISITILLCCKEPVSESKGDG